MKIIDYSERAIVLQGDTKPIKDTLREMGGKFNPYLKCGAGWVFPKTKRDAIEAYLNPPKQEVVKQVKEKPKQAPKKIEKMGKTLVKITGFMAGEYPLPNNKVEKFVKGVLKTKAAHIKDTNEVCPLKIEYCKL